MSKLICPECGDKATVYPADNCLPVECYTECKCGWQSETFYVSDLIVELTVMQRALRLACAKLGRRGCDNCHLCKLDGSDVCCDVLAAEYRNAAIAELQTEATKPITEDA